MNEKPRKHEMKTVKITDDQFDGLDEIYGFFYQCPDCGCDKLMSNHKFCLQCGVKLAWEVMDDFERGRDGKRSEN